MWTSKLAAKCEARIAEIMKAQGFIEGTAEYDLSMERRMRSMRVIYG